MQGCVKNNLVGLIFSKDSTMQAQNSHWPVITMSALGKFGRFGNQLFQYASLRIYARKYNLRTETPKWIGQRLFGCYDQPIQKKLPLVEVPNKLVPFWEEPTFYAKQPLTSVDLKGYFQYHTKYYVKYKEHLRSLFSPLPEIEAKMRIGLDSLCSKGKTLVGLHLRRGDFGHHHHFIAPSQWYKEWLKGFWETLEDPVLFIASDEPEKVVGDFVEYKPVTSAELGMELAEAPFYPDFYILTQCDAVAISNSTFSFVACMLNKRGKIFARPTLSNRKLIPFDPWNSESNFKDEKVAANESYHEQTDACTETGSTASSGDSNSFCRNSGTLVSGNEKNRDITVKPKVSVLMSVYNGERFVTEALKSIYNQTYQDFEVIIVDDGSTDRTSEILLNLKDSRTFIYRNPENLGLTKSLNIGLKLCRGQYVARMDADDISHPQRFERQVKFLDENPGCLVLGCWYGRIDSDGKIWGSKETPTEYEDTKKQLLIEACVGHGTAIVRRAALVEVGGYNEQYTYAQDYDLWLRLSEVGLIRNLDEYLYLLRSWPGNISTIKLKEQTEFAELAIRQALQRRYGNGPIDREVSYGFVKRAITWFNLREYVNCINTLSNTQKMAPNIKKRFKGYDLLLALSYFAIGREQQCLTCLRREIQNHNNPAAGKFLSDYFEKNLRMDVQNWCSQNSRHYNLQLVDMENEGCPQRQNNNISEPYVSEQQSEQKGVQQSSCCKRYEPLVSVIMPAYNAQKFITEAIQSVLSQTYRNFELVVVDDGSTDGTKDIVFSFKDERIKYFYHENSGLAATHNTGIRNSKGLFLVKLDSDDMMTADFIAAHLAEFEKHPDVDLVYCDDCLIEENSNPIRVIERPKYTDRRLLIRDLFHCGFPVVPFRTCIRRSVFDKIGFFDEELLVGEDYDMMRRFVKHGLKIHHLKGALYLRRMTSNSLSRNCSAQKAKSQFDVVKRFTDTFTYDELFPDIKWDKIAPEIRQLHAKCLTAGTYLAIGQEYVKTNATEYSRTAFDRACSELNDCLKMDPENQGLRQLLQKSKLIRARYTETPQQLVSK